MASRYWVGGTDVWNSTAGSKWALTSGGAGGQAVPTTSDDVFFDAASGAVTVSSSTSRSAKSLNFTGFTGTFSVISTTTVAGSVTASAAMTWAGTGTITCTATGTITSAGIVIGGAVNVSGSGITVTLADDLSITGTLSLTQGTLDAAANNVDVSALSLSSSNSNTRTLKLGSGTWSITTASGSAWNIFNSFGMTLNAGTSTIKFTDTSTGSKSFSGGGLTYNDVWFAGGTVSLDGGNTINDIKCDGGVGNQISFTAGSTTTVSSLTMGNSAALPVILTGATRGSSYTISTSSALAASYVAVADMHKSGAGSITFTDSFDLGDNVDVTFASSGGGGGSAGLPASRVSLGM
jgi:hypothetical protein